MGIWCVGSSAGLTQIDSGQQYDAATGSLRGAFACPTDDAADPDAGAGL